MLTFVEVLFVFIPNFVCILPLGSAFGANILLGCFLKFDELGLLLSLKVSVQPIDCDVIFTILVWF